MEGTLKLKIELYQSWLACGTLETADRFNEAMEQAFWVEIRVIFTNRQMTQEGEAASYPVLRASKKEGNWTALLKEVQLPFLKLLRLSWPEWLRTYTDSFLPTLCRVGMEWCWPRMGISHIEWVFALPLVPQGSGCCGALPVGSPLQQHVKHGDSAPGVVAIIIITNLFRKKSNRLKYISVCLLSKIPSCI